MTDLRSRDRIMSEPRHQGPAGGESRQNCPAAQSDRIFDAERPALASGWSMAVAGGRRFEELSGVYDAFAGHDHPSLVRSL